MKKERKSIMKHLCCQPTRKMVVYNYTPFSFLIRETFILLVNFFFVY